VGPYNRLIQQLTTIRIYPLPHPFTASSQLLKLDTADSLSDTLLDPKNTKLHEFYEFCMCQQHDDALLQSTPTEICGRQYKAVSITVQDEPSTKRKNRGHPLLKTKQMLIKCQKKNV